MSWLTVDSEVAAIMEEHSSDPLIGAIDASDAGSSNGTGLNAAPDPESAAQATLEPAHAAEDVPAESPGLVAELARAMHEAAAAERTRIGADIDRRREAHLAGVEARRESEATRMRELAADDRSAIQQWVEAEQKRIKAERERRLAELEEDLKTSLAEHTTTFEREVEAVEAAITSHRAEVEGFFSSIEQETDLVRIAQQASSRLTFPDLDSVTYAADSASASAPVELEPVPVEPATAQSIEQDDLPEPVGVMDSQIAARPDGAWIVPGEPASQGAGTDAGSTDPRDELSEESASEPVLAVPVAMASGRSAGNGDGSKTLLHSTPISRPMGWLRRDHDQGDR